MAYIFMDESGDLGFRKNTKKSSRYFILVFLIVEEKKTFEKLIKKANTSLNRKASSGTIHATSEKEETILKVLKNLEKAGCCKIMAIRLNKEMSGSIKDIHLLYAEMTNVLLGYAKDYINSYSEKIGFVASQRETKKSLNEQFSELINAHAKKVFPNPNPNFEIRIRRPAQEKCLQLVDVIAWAISRKYEHGEFRFFDIIKSLVVTDIDFSQKQ